MTRFHLCSWDERTVHAPGRKILFSPLTSATWSHALLATPALSGMRARGGERGGQSGRVGLTHFLPHRLRGMIRSNRRQNTQRVGHLARRHHQRTSFAHEWWRPTTNDQRPTTDGPLGLGCRSVTFPHEWMRHPCPTHLNRPSLFWYMTHLHAHTRTRDMRTHTPTSANTSSSSSVVPTIPIICQGIPGRCPSPKTHWVIFMPLTHPPSRAQP